MCVSASTHVIAFEVVLHSLFSCKSIQYSCYYDSVQICNYAVEMCAYLSRIVSEATLHLNYSFAMHISLHIAAAALYPHDVI